jgi:hypothetical protein
MFADRIGTPAMHKGGMQAGQVYDADTTYKIQRELRIVPHVIILGDTDPAEERPRWSVEECLELCRKQLSGLEGFIIELCIDPKLRFATPGETEQDAAVETIAINEQFQTDHPPTGPYESHFPPQPNYRPASLPYFQDIIGALFDYQRHYQENVLKEHVQTEVGRIVFEVLDIGLRTGKLVLVEGNSRIGKTTATEAWCNSHLGEARFVSLSGITHKTGVFRALAKVLGIGSSYARSSTEMQTRIEDLLQRSGLMIVVDEAHHLFSSSERVYSRPELVDWLDTSLYNHHVPIGLLCTPQFGLRMARAQKQTTWNADQLRGRVKRWQILPARPSDKDLASVAHKLLPNVASETIKLLTGYARACNLPFPAMVDAIDEALALVKRDGRTEITFEDMDRAITDYCTPSNEAMARDFEKELSSKRGGNNSKKEKPSPTVKTTLVPNHVSAPSGRRGKKDAIAPEPPAITTLPPARMEVLEATA